MFDMSRPKNSLTIEIKLIFLCIFDTLWHIRILPHFSFCVIRITEEQNKWLNLIKRHLIEKRSHCCLKKALTIYIKFDVYKS